MHQRCENEKHKQFADYGGRGITVCEQWSDFRNFLADMGERPLGLTLDREQTNGNYEPRNCRWATPKEQTLNQRPKVRNAEILELLAAAKDVVSSSFEMRSDAIENLKAAVEQFEKRRQR